MLTVLKNLRRSEADHSTIVIISIETYNVMYIVVRDYCTDMHTCAHTNLGSNNEYCVCRGSDEYRMALFEAKQEKQRQEVRMCLSPSHYCEQMIDRF